MRTIDQIVRSKDILMGHLAIKQPLPTTGIDQISPFLLLHHLHLKDVEAGTDPLAVGPHPHRGFEPVTFIFDGEVAHRDSRGNDAAIGAGGVQWMTAGMGIVHAEEASKTFIQSGGDFQIVQLWVNLPKQFKMVQPRYQAVSKDQIPVVLSQDGKTQTRVIAGSIGQTRGPVETHSPITTLHVIMEEGGQTQIEVPRDFNASVYLLEGSIKVNTSIEVSATDLVRFNNDGKEVLINANEKSHFLVLAGEPINEPVVQHGPFVMNTQTEILEAMRDYQQGKMGLLTY